MYVCLALYGSCLLADCRFQVKTVDDLERALRQNPVYLTDRDVFWIENVFRHLYVSLFPWLLL
jgi:hypothetical protein